MPDGKGLEFLQELPLMLGDRFGGRALMTGGNMHLRAVAESEGIHFFEKPMELLEIEALRHRIATFLTSG